MDTVNILGIDISTLSKKKVLKKIEQFLKDGLQRHIITPNPEFLLEAQKNEEFFYILKQAGLAIPDGIGLKFAGWFLGKNIKRITGADLAQDILKMAQDKNLKVGILNWDKGLSSKKDIEKAIEEKYARLRFAVEDIGKKDKFSNSLLLRFRPNILFVTLGAPWQEKFIYHNLHKLPSVKVAMGVGGSLDYLTGRIKRAPRLMRWLGLEWLWRLFMQPWRWKRIKNAVAVFPYQFLKQKLVLQFLYRPNVACFLYKKERGKYKVLLVERRHEDGHWQLPQGGKDGEDTETAGARELKEEIGTNKFKKVACFDNLYKYQFGKRAGEIKKEASKGGRKHTGYKGQKQSLFIAEFLGHDTDISINFWDHSGWKWVNADNLLNEVHLIRKRAAGKFLEKFNAIITKT